MIELTNEQRAAIESRGKVIVSASAGSGKTFVMIRKMVDAILGGVDLDSVLAVTFTKKAAAQMKEKLRCALRDRLAEADEKETAALKLQLAKVPSAEISTIHAFCSRLIRTYFYVLGIDGGFDIIAADDAAANELKDRALDNLFERLYAQDDPEFKLVLKCLMKKRSDNSVRALLKEAHSRVRTAARYGEILKRAEELYTEQGFSRVCESLKSANAPKYDRLIAATREFADGFPVTAKKAAYDRIFAEMTANLTAAKEDIFADIPLTKSRKPADAEEDKEAGESFKSFKERISKRYAALRKGVADIETEREAFFESGRLAAAFSRLLMQFDREYAEVKRDESKLDYNDLEHMTLELLQDESVRAQINSRYKYVYIDEYQDVNPVQEEILSQLGENVFMVGDVKQAIYGFRGSRSEFFSEKFGQYSAGAGTALRLSDNFRSADRVLEFSNSLFSEIMTKDTCGIDYAGGGVMRGGGSFEGGGSAEIVLFGDDGQESEEITQVYSVLRSGGEIKHTREGLAVLALVKKILTDPRGHFDREQGRFVPTQAGDICILTRKNKGVSHDGIVRALIDGGYRLAGAKDDNICELPEVKQFLDILSYIDNAEQDYPLVSALLSPVGGFCEDELARIRVSARDKKTFRDCCKSYLSIMRDSISQKLDKFYNAVEELRDLSEILNAGELADEILTRYLPRGDGAINILTLMEEGTSLTLGEFLQKIKSGGYSVSAPARAQSDSIKIMSMHAAKGLEFPVVIIGDITRTFRGSAKSDLPFDESFGFAPQCYDTENMTCRGTILRQLLKIRSDEEELKNEYNLFYVACTRAEYRLYVMAKEQEEYDPLAVTDAKSYSELFDMSKYPAETLDGLCETDGTQESIPMFGAPDPVLLESAAAQFMRKYGHAASVDLPVKSSASAILKMSEDDRAFTPKELFGGEGETGTERGTAYHRFLELCDFSVKSRKGIESEIENFVESGRLERAQSELLDADELAQILAMPAFDGLEGKQLFREQEFLCRIPANELFDDTAATDFVLVQGAIDLLVRGDGTHIIDYKYSNRGDEELKEHYRKQLLLYKKAVSLITGDSAETIRTTIVNIHRKSQMEIY